jgi:hypothetical protein
MNFPFSLNALSRAALAALALTLTVSCLPNSGPFAGGGPFNTQPAYTGSGGERTQIPTTTRSRRPALAATSVFFGSGGGGYYDRGYGYRSSGYCNTCGYNPCRCSSHSGYRSSYSSHYGHDNHSGFSSSRSRSSSSSDHDHKAEHPHAHDTYAVAGGSLRSTQTKPSGYHSLDWYKSRGYDTGKLKLVNEHGQSKGSSSRSPSSKPKSSSSSSKSKSSGSKSDSSSSKKRGRLSP